jgi:hypothetical protein
MRPHSASASRNTDLAIMGRNRSLAINDYICPAFDPEHIALRRIGLGFLIAFLSYVSPAGNLIIRMNRAISIFGYFSIFVMTRVQIATFQPED